MVMIAPDNIRDGDTFSVELEVTPMDAEVPYPIEYTQNPTFQFSSSCDGFVSCISGQILNPSGPTIGLFVGLGLVVLIAKEVA